LIFLFLLCVLHTIDGVEFRLLPKLRAVLRTAKPSAVDGIISIYYIK
jgi:hypothetical protein